MSKRDSRRDLIFILLGRIEACSSGIEDLSIGEGDAASRATSPEVQFGKLNTFSQNTREHHATETKFFAFLFHSEKASTDVLSSISRNKVQFSTKGEGDFRNTNTAGPGVQVDRECEVAVGGNGS